MTLAARKIENAAAPYKLAAVEHNLKTYDLGPALMALRLEGFTRLEKLPFPSNKDELWRQTKPELFRLACLESLAPVQFSLSPFLASSKSLPPGIRMQCGKDAGLAEGSLLKNLYGAAFGDTSNDAILQLHSAAMNALCVLRVKKGTASSEVVKLDLNTPSQGSAAPLILIILEEGSELNLLQDLRFTGPFLFPRVEVLLEANAHLTYTIVQNLPGQTQHLERQRVHLAKDSTLSCTQVNIGAALSRVDLDLRLTEPGASAGLQGVYLADGERHLDFHPTQEHLAPHCSSNLLYKGALKDRARSVYYGFIRVAEAAQQTDAYQQNRNLMLSEEAVADSIPNLEIKANDVKCSHGASVGQVGAEDLFYLMSRGLARQQAEKLLVEGFFEEVLALVKQTELNAYLRSLVMERLYAS